MSSRRFALVMGLAAAAVCGLAAACSNDSSTAADTPAGEDAQPNLPASTARDAADTGTGDAAACSAVYATDFDRSCTTDSDCVAVPFGGNLCDPCGTSAQCFQCPIDSVNKSAAAAYLATLKAAVGAAEAQNPSLECFIASCPIISDDAGDEPKCVSGTCAGFPGSCQ